MVVDNGKSNTYEEARQKRLDENKKRFEELGILDISKSLSKLSSPEKKHKPRQLKPSATNSEVVEPRRSSRARNTVASYQDDLDIGISPTRKKARFSSSSSSWTSYIARPLEEVKLAAYEDRMCALRAAEEFQSNLQSGNPSFVKSMVRSHVYSCFWLGLPTQFCNKHLPKKDVDMILEDENGSTCDARYLGSRTGLSGGWRGFALDHKLDDGDAVVFELVEPNKFKLYIFKVSSSKTQVDVAEEEGSAKTKSASGNQNKSKSHPTKKQNPKKAKTSKVPNSEKSEPQESETQVDVAEEEGSAKTKSASGNQNKCKSRPTKKQNPKKAKASKGSNTETSEPQGSQTQVDVAEEDNSSKAENASRYQNKSRSRSTKKQNSKEAKASKATNIETSKPQDNSASEMIANHELSAENDGVIEENDAKDDLEVNKQVVSVVKNDKQKRPADRPRKKSAPKLFRRRF